MAQLEPMFATAIDRGELTVDVDREALFSFAAGAIWFRTFVTGRGADDAFINFVVASVCSLYCSCGTAPKVSLPPRIA